MVSEYRRGWEDALDVALELRDWEKIEKLRNQMSNERINSQINGPI